MEDESSNNPRLDSQEEPEVYAVVIDGRLTHFNRRDFLQKAGLAAAAATVLASGCTPAYPAPQAAPAQTDTNVSKPKPTSTRKAISTKTSVPPTPTITNTPTPTGIGSVVTGDRINFREGPSTGYPAITQLSRGDAILLTARLADSSWVAVALADPSHIGRTVNGWIKTTLVDTNGKDIASLPVITDIPPTPTPLPGRSGKAQPGQKGRDYTFTDSYGHTFYMTLPCGSALPAGATCSCDCITVPGGCSCVENNAESCSCVGFTSCECIEHYSNCSCDTIHYWYPN